MDKKVELKAQIKMIMMIMMMMMRQKWRKNNWVDAVDEGKRKRRK